VDEAIRHYRRALELDRELAGAHYGLAFLLLKRGDPDGATQHLRAFLAHPPKGPDAQKWIEHATQALRDLGASGPAPAATGSSRSRSPHPRTRLKNSTHCSCTASPWTGTATRSLPRSSGRRSTQRCSQS